MTIGGSHAYGTNVEGSDVDIRGAAGSPEILGFNRFEQVINNQTDTVIYAINKFVNLLVQCNPNVIELLGNDPKLYVNMTPEGQMLLDNKELFLTRRIAYSYGGFANDSSDACRWDYCGMALLLSRSKTSLKREASND